MNHRTRLDWMYLWSVLVRQSGVKTEKIILKDPLKYIPGAGNLPTARKNTLVTNSLEKRVQMRSGATFWNISMWICTCSPICEGSRKFNSVKAPDFQSKNSQICECLQMRSQTHSQTFKKALGTTISVSERASESALQISTKNNLQREGTLQYWSQEASTVNVFTFEIERLRGIRYTLCKQRHIQACCSLTESPMGRAEDVGESHYFRTK